MNAAQQKQAQAAEKARHKKEQEATKGKGQQQDAPKPAKAEPAKDQGKQPCKQCEELRKEIESLKATNAKHAERNKKVREAVIATGKFTPAEVGGDVSECIKKLAGTPAGRQQQPFDDAAAPQPAHGSSAHKRTDGPFPEGGQADPRDHEPDHATAATPDGRSGGDE